EKKRLKELADLEKIRLETRKRTLQAIHAFETQAIRSQIERLEAVVDDERRTNQDRLEAAHELAEERIKLATMEKDHLLAMNDLAMTADLNRLDAMKAATQADLNAVVDIYDKANERIVAVFGEKVEKATKVAFDLEFKLNESTMRRLGDEMVDNWKGWFRELNAGSSAAWSSVAQDATSNLTRIGQMFFSWGDDVSLIMDGIADIISGALSGQPFQLIGGALNIVGGALLANKRAAEEYSKRALIAAENEKRAADEALRAAKAFLKASGQVDTTLLSFNELQEAFGEAAQAAAEQPGIAGIPLEALVAVAQGVGFERALDIPGKVGRGEGLSPDEQRMWNAWLVSGGSPTDMEGFTKWARAVALAYATAAPDAAAIIQRGVTIAKAITVRGAGGLESPTSWRGQQDILKSQYNRGEIDAAGYISGLKQILATPALRNQMGPTDIRSMQDEIRALEATTRKETISALAIVAAERIGTGPAFTKTKAAVKGRIQA
ncbi:unnamed protein product, partial [marine sediment metagenome]